MLLRAVYVPISHRAGRCFAQVGDLDAQTGIVGSKVGNIFHLQPVQTGDILRRDLSAALDPLVHRRIVEQNIQRDREGAAVLAAQYVSQFVKLHSALTSTHSAGKNSVGSSTAIRW